MSRRLEPPPPRALVFDLDGTLVDSRRDLATALNRTRAELGLPPLMLAEVVGMVGEGARRLVEKAIGPDVPPERFEPVFGRYLQHYRAVLLDTTRPYDGVPEALERLAARYPLAVLTNKPEELSRALLAGLGLLGWFAALLGGDSLPSRKPDPAGLLHLAARLGAPPADVLLVGDSAIDAATARAAGARFALVTWGFPRPADLAAVPADARYATPGELAAAFVTAAGRAG
ncbi:MAG TPA: HAD-IA family hydrolase [Thermoanaerobaculia bacterium]|nr:HAD-IA family hydrolase [Thermoanaerobaculia bacterium]